MGGEQVLYISSMSPSVLQSFRLQVVWAVLEKDVVPSSQFAEVLVGMFSDTTLVSIS